MFQLICLNIRLSIEFGFTPMSNPKTIVSIMLSIRIIYVFDLTDFLYSTAEEDLGVHRDKKFKCGIKIFHSYMFCER